MDLTQFLVVIWVATVAAIVAVVVFGIFAVRPLVQTWVEVRKTQDRMLPLLDEVVNQVRTDSGTSLLDVVNRLDRAAQAQVTAAEIMAANIEAARELAVTDSASLARMEAKGDQVAEDLAVAQEHAGEALDRGDEAGVAADQAAVHPTHHGEKAPPE